MEGEASKSEEQHSEQITSQLNGTAPVIPSKTLTGDEGKGSGEKEGKEDKVQSDTQKEEVPESDAFSISLRTCGEKKILIPLQVSPIDNLQDIKQFIFESVDTCYITNYHLMFNGKILNQFSDIGEIPEIKTDSILEMHESNYDERSIRFHVRRLREILSAPEAALSPSLFSKIARDAEHIQVKDEPDTEDIDLRENLLLSKFYPNQSSNRIPCLKSLVFSGWNPPPGNRKLMGDLLYLTIVTLENRTVFITGSSKGFFVNRSTELNFDPSMHENAHRCHNLVGLLNKLSSLFKKNFQSLLTSYFQEHLFEMLPVPYPVLPWAILKETHTYDLNRAEDALLFTSEADMRGQLRDWNEEYQSCKELPNETIQERITRDRALVKVNCDFVEAATKGASAIIEGTVSPINPLDPEKAHMYIYNNIFFSYATDGRDFYKEYGGDKAAYISVNNDLKGIKALNSADVSGLYTLATAIIDYRGKRICAQSIIPGILQREQTSTVVYGSIDSGKTIPGDEEFHKLLTAAGKILGIREHKVVDSEGKEVSLCSPVEAKGIVGTDGRRYILDLIRATPRDTNFSGKDHMLTILRPELIAAFIEGAREKERQEIREARKKEKEQKEEQENPPKEDKGGKEEVPDPAEQANSEEAEKKELEKQEEEEIPNELLGDYSLNPNALCDLKLGGSPEEIAKDEAMVQQVTKFLNDVIIPMTVEELTWLFSIPVDGPTLRSVMHARGINIRYLGKIATLSEKNTVIKELAVREMITRGAKHVLRALLKETEDFNLAACVSHFLNCLFGVTEPVSKAKNQTSKKKKKKSTAFSKLGTTILWGQLVQEVQERFQYNLPAAKDEIRNIVVNISTLRSLCQKVGIQVHARDYDFEADQPFQPEDILNLFPIVKHCNPESSDGKNLLEAGKTFLAQGRLDIAYELLSEALTIFHQVYGPMHRDTANCYGNLAMVLYHAKDITQALDHQQKATIINERVLGLDHYDTTHSYGNLALFCHNMNKPGMALACIKRALYLGSLVCGPNHADVATTLTNIAMMLQDMGKHKQGIQYLLEALRVYESLLGTNHIQTAAIYHAVAIAYSQLGQFKEALSFEKRNYNILHAKVGDNDIRAIESNIWLSQFTKKAVEEQKAKLELASQLSKLTNITPSSKSGLEKSLTNSASDSMGTRPLSEIMQYINDKSGPGSSFMQRNKRYNTSTEPGSTEVGKKKKKSKTKKKEDNLE